MCLINIKNRYALTSYWYRLPVTPHHYSDLSTVRQWCDTSSHIFCLEQNTHTQQSLMANHTF